MRFAQSANAGNRRLIGQNGGNWPIQTQKFIFLCLWEQKQRGQSFSKQTLRYCTRAKLFDMGIICAKITPIWHFQVVFKLLIAGKTIQPC